MLQPEPHTKRVTRYLPMADSDSISKSDLAKELRWSRAKLDRRLENDPRFPVVYRGGRGQGREWKFDLEAVKTYLNGHTESASDLPAIEESAGGTNLSGQKRAFSVDPDVAPDETFERTYGHTGEETAKQRLVTAQAAIQEDRLLKARGELVHIEDLKTSISAMLLHLGKGLDSLPDRIVQMLNLPPEQTLTIRELINQLRTSMVSELNKILQPDA
jgi:phage terminase Nu1 subunit (DNA packaging protein)